VRAARKACKYIRAALRLAGASKLTDYRASASSLRKQLQKRRRKLQAAAFELGGKLYQPSAKHIESAIAARLADASHRS
jgi:hypothetical protein